MGGDRAGRPSVILARKRLMIIGGVILCGAFFFSVLSLIIWVVIKSVFKVPDNWEE